MCTDFEEIGEYLPAIEGSYSQQVSDALPEVSFDIGLGQKYSYVDFDYNAYKREVNTMGGTNSDFENAKILFKDRGISLTRGLYSPVDESMVVKLSSKTNQVLAHETRHYLDHQRGQLDKARVISANLSYAATIVADIALFTMIALSALPETTSVGRFGDDWIDETRAIQLGAAMSFLYLYYLSPAEIRARTSGMIHARNVVTLTK